MDLNICCKFFIYTIICSTAVVESYNFLAILPTAFKSHFIFGSALMKGLAEKGHAVYVISPFPQEKSIENYYDFAFSYQLDEKKGEANKTNDDIELTTPFQEANMAKAIFQSPDIQRLLRTNITFDAVICEVFYSEALFGFSEHFKAPLIGLSSLGYNPRTTSMIGSPAPSSYVPSVAMLYTDRMSPEERFNNLYIEFRRQLHMQFRVLWRQAGYYNTYFPHLKRDLYTVRNNAAAVLINTHITLDYPRPHLPNHVAVGGLHIKRQPSYLFNDIGDFIRNSDYGVIYFSMGTNNECKNYLDLISRKILLELQTLPQSVIWQLDDPELEGVHENVLIRRWLPQQDILAHENVKVFITQGGLLSISEAIYHATPFVGIPLIGDQHYNMYKAEIEGIGKTLPYKHVNAENITQAVRHVLQNESYTRRIKELSARYRDQPILPLDLAIYWVERVARQKGSKQLHCAGLDLNFFQYYNIDAILTLSVGIMLFMWFVFYTVKHFPKKWFVRKKTVRRTRKLIPRRVFTKKKRR